MSFAILSKLRTAYIGLAALFLLLVLLVGLTGARPFEISGIIIDGDFSDWEGITPIIVDEEVNPNMTMDIQAGFVTNSSTKLFFRVDFANQYDCPMIFVNLTLRIPNGTVFVLMGIVYYGTELYSQTGVFKGTELNHPYNAEIDYIVQRIGPGTDGWAAVDNTTNSKLEFCYLLTDMDIQPNDSLDLVFWHFDNFPVMIMNGRGTAKPNQEIYYRRYPTEGYLSYQVRQHQKTDTTTDTQEKSTSTESFNLGVGFIILALIVIKIAHKRTVTRRNNEL